MENFIHAGYGPHLVIDLYGVEPALLADFPRIYRFMTDLPKKLGMDILFPTYAHDFVNENPRESGVTAVVGLTTSHASIHTYPYMTSTDGKEGIAFLDIFSCKPFDVPMVLQLVRDEFHPQEIDSELKVRGKKFPGLSDRGEVVSA